MGAMKPPLQAPERRDRRNLRDQRDHREDTQSFNPANSIDRANSALMDEMQDAAKDYIAADKVGRPNGWPGSGRHG